jgi:hypothetical protein
MYICKMNQLLRDDFQDDSFLKAIRLTTNHEDMIMDSAEARQVLAPTIARLKIVLPPLEGNSESV